MSTKFVERRKLSKKEQKQWDKSMRVFSGFNTGTRVFKDAKHPSRQKIKKDLKKMLDNE